MIRWGGKENTLILRMIEDESGAGGEGDWPYNTAPNDRTAGENTNPPPAQDDPIDEVPITETNPVPDSEDPPAPADLPDVEPYVPEPIDPPPLPEGIFPDNAEQWVRGTIIERNQTRLIRLDTSYTSAASDFFGDDGSSIVETPVILTSTDAPFNGEWTVVGTGEFLRIALTAPYNTGIESFATWSTFGVEVGDTITIGTGDAFVIDGIEEGGVSARIAEPAGIAGIETTSFSIDITTDEVVVDPVIGTYTDNQVDYYEITSTGESPINLQENTLQGQDGTFYDIVPGDRVDVKFTPPTATETPNWLGAFFVPIHDIREVAIGDDYFAALGLTTFTFSNGQTIRPAQTPLANWWIQTELSLGSLTPADINAYNEWVASDFKIAPIPQVAIKPFVFQVGSYGPPDPDDLDIEGISDGLLYGQNGSGTGLITLMEQQESGFAGVGFVTYGDIATENGIGVQAVIEIHQNLLAQINAFNATVTQFEEEVVTWTEIYGPDLIPIYDSDPDSGTYGEPMSGEVHGWDADIFHPAHSLYDWFTTAISLGQISQDQLNDYRVWLESSRTISPFSIAQYPPPPFVGQLPEINLKGCVDDRAMNWIRWAAIDDGSCLYIPHIADSVLWQWGDGTYDEQLLEPGNIEPYNHTYTQPGIYTVNMFLRYVDGDVDAFQTKIAIKTQPTPVKNLWEWGDGDYDETEGEDFPPAHIYKSPGLYQVTLTTLYSDGIDSYTKTTSRELIIFPNDAATITMFAYGKEENSSDIENEMTFIIGAKDMDGQIVKYEFDFGDGSDIIEKDVELEDKMYHDTETFTERKRYRRPGVYVAKASVRDNSGNISTTHKIIYVDDVKYIPTYEPYVAQITDVISPTIIEVDRSWAEEAQFVKHVWGNPGAPAPNEAEDGEWANGKEWEYPFKSAQSNWRLKEKRDLRTLINLGSDRFMLVTNFRSDNLSFKNWPNSVVFKLYRPLPNSVTEKDFVWVSREMLPPLTKVINLIDFVDEKIDGIVLRQPDYWSTELPFESTRTDWKNRQDIVSSNTDVASVLEDKFVSQSDLSIELNQDYSNYKNFIKFSSIQKRYDNFEYKIKRIEHYNNLSSSLIPISGSSADIRSAERSIREVKNSFDGLEKYMYFQSSSYTTSSLGEFYDTSWPKESGTGTLLNPYVLAPSTSSQYLRWKGGNDDSASLYDRQNLDRLVNNLPLHVRDDDRNEQFFRFVDMIGHHFDDIWSYTKALTDINHRTNKVDEGLSRDLVHEVAKGFGWKVYDGKNLISLPKYQLGVEVSGSNNVAIQTSAEAERDITREVWNRILVNMPYFLKTKGTSRALKGLISCYGLPTTILRVREYGGPILPEQNPVFEITRKYRRSLNFFGSQYVETTWVDDTSTSRKPDTVEFRFRAVQSGSGEVKQVLYQKGTDWAIGLTDDGSADNYGYLTFALSGSGVGKEITSSLLPVFDNEFWSVMVTRLSSSGEPLSVDTDSQDIDYTMYLKKYDATRNRIYLQSSSSLSIDGDTESAFNAAFISDGSGYVGGKSTRDFGNQLTGSMMEFRYWNSPLSQSNFDNHVRAPKTYNGNHPSASYTDLVLRYSFSKEMNHGTGSIDILDTSADQSYVQTGSARNYPDRDSYDYTVDVEEFVVPNFGPQMRRATKIRIEENRLIYGSKLSVDSRNEVSAYDLTSTDSNKLGIFFAPTDVINEDIMFSMGNLDFSDYIGDPRDQFKTYYRGLRKIKDIYWQKYTSPNNFWDYLRILKFYDKAIFDQIKSLIPARANAVLGTLIDPNILERSKVVIGKPPEIENTYYEDSIDLNYAESASGQYLDTDGFISESMYPSFTGTEDYYQTFISESVYPGLKGTSDYYQTFVSESVYPGLNGTNDYYQAFISESIVPTMFGFYIDTDGFISESMYPSFTGEYSDYTSSINIFKDVLSWSGTYEDFSTISLYGPNSSTTIDTFDTFLMPSLYSFTNNARGDNIYSGSYIAGHNGGYSGGQDGKSIFEEVTIPMISSSRVSEYHKVEQYFYNSKESFYKAGNMNVKEHQRYHSNSSSLSPAEVTPLYESTTALRNLFFDGCKQTNDTTPDGKESIEVIITSPTILTTKESGDSKLSVE